VSLAHQLPLAVRRTQRVARRLGVVTAPVSAPAEAEPAGAPDREYWLEHCDGFRVDGPRGRIGVVEEVRHTAEGGSLLVIRTGVLGLRAVAISTREVFEIVPRARRLWLKTPDSAFAWLPEASPELLEPARARVAA
jgi:hypothetical protein